MPRKVVLIAGASGLVGYAAMQHFAREPGCEVIAVSRRRPDTTFGARFLAVDLTDTQDCARAFSALGHVTHVVYAALYERPGLIAGWRNSEQITVNDRMLRNLMEPLEQAARHLQHVSLLQGTKAYGVHVQPMKIPAREGRSDRRDVPNFYWNQEAFLREKQRGKSWYFSIFRPVLIVGYSQGSAMNVIPALGTYAAILKAAGQPLHYPGGPPRWAKRSMPICWHAAWPGPQRRRRHATRRSTSPMAMSIVGRIFGRPSPMRSGWCRAIAYH